MIELVGGVRTNHTFLWNFQLTGHVITDDDGRSCIINGKWKKCIAIGLRRNKRKSFEILFKMIGRDHLIIIMQAREQIVAHRIRQAHFNLIVFGIALRTESKGNKRFRIVCEWCIIVQIAIIIQNDLLQNTMQRKIFVLGRVADRIIIVFENKDQWIQNKRFIRIRSERWRRIRNIGSRRNSSPKRMCVSAN